MRGRRAAAGAALLLSAMLGVGCGGEGRERADSATTPPSANPSAATATAGSASGASAATAGDCPATGAWATCSVEKRLRDAGLVPALAPDTVRHDFLSVPGRSYTLGRAELQVFLYPDSATVARDVAALDTVRVAPKAEAARWQVRPTFIRSANLIALLISTNERQIERVQLTLTAGPPR